MAKTRDPIASPRPQVEKIVLGSDWRRRYQQSPALFLMAAALGGGLLVALAAGARKSPAGRVFEHETAGPGPVATGGAGNLAFEAVKGAIIGVAVSQAKGALSQLLSGFARHLTEPAAARHSSERG